MRPSLAFALAVLFASVSLAAGTLDVYVIDTEGGKAVILVAPAGGTMLIDAGYPREDNRDTERIVATAQSLGIRQFDYIVSTHYDADHVGNVPEVAGRIPAHAYVDHGPPMSSGPGIDRFLNPYLHFIQGKKRVSVKPGDTIPVKGLQITVVSSGGEVLAKPLKGAGKPNASCASAAIPDKLDLSENAASIGLLVEFGKFRMADLADLTKPVEYELVCPDNLVGDVDLFMVSHHGLTMSNSLVLVHALRPKVAIMNNGARKGGAPEVFDTLVSSPRIQDIWQLHYSPAAGKEKNPPAQFIANMEEKCDARMIKVSAREDGSFTVTNTRNNFSKTYNQ